MFSQKKLESGEDGSISFSAVLRKEQDVLQESRIKRQVPIRSRPIGEDTVGLAFSGGGIRSATFNLGVTQALARCNLLNLVDYLSTVSGGGFIGSWLSSWAYHISKREGANQNHIAQIEAELNRTARAIGDVAEPNQIYFLRKYSNYLTPRLGVLSGDTLAFVATYIRNLLLNQVILVAALFSLLLVPRLVGLIFLTSYRLNRNASIAICVVLSLILLVVVFVQVLFNMGPVRTSSPRTIVRQIAVPLFLFCSLLSYVLWQLILRGFLYASLPRKGELIIITLSTVVYVGLWVLSTVLAPPNSGQPSNSDPVRSTYLHWAPAFWAAPAGVAAGLFILVAARVMQYWIDQSPGDGNWRYLVAFGIPLSVATVLLVGVVHLGLIGRAYEDGLREWWARLGGVVLAVAICWFLLSVSTLFVPKWLRLVMILALKSDSSWSARTWKLLSAVGVIGLVGGWIAATLKGLLSAKSNQAAGPSQSSDNGGRSSANPAEVAVRIAPPVFATGLVIILSVVLYFTFPLETTKCWEILAICICLYVLSRFFGERVDVNEFSLHNAYRNRIVRCYLGATNNDRQPQPFTGFDENDNIYLAGLLGLGAPFHILNATLNIVKGKELALQARKARSFTFTPLYSGFDSTSSAQAVEGGSYRLTKHYSWESRYQGARLGTAMAISGAAASPNMGHYTTGAVSFLLTIFSVRLGWWLGNPRKKKCWESAYPKSSWRAIMNELTGNTDDDQDEVYLSDGGHFENLGIYELVRRRCRVIVACDAGADVGCACNDLASAIEKCRVDFGTQIDIELDDIRPATQLLPEGQSLRLSKSPFAIGTIHYPDDRKGTLVYIKPSLNAELPQDVLAYARLAAAFPHQSTADQFFDEAQFESYRALGFACALAARNEISTAIRN
jgi:predicted acylesterase/phospholipase RssA